MSTPEGKLTGTQLEIMEVIWDLPAGAKVAEIWQTLSEQRQVARTTVLTMVQRLEKRGWLQRCDATGSARYQATCSREDASSDLAAGFLDEFFNGSAAQLVSSLLGSRRLKKTELKRLRKLLDEQEGPAR